MLYVLFLKKGEIKVNNDNLLDQEFNHILIITNLATKMVENFVSLNKHILFKLINYNIYPKLRLIILK